MMRVSSPHQGVPPTFLRADPTEFQQNRRTLRPMVHRSPATVLVAQLVEQRHALNRWVVRIEAAAPQQLAQHIGSLEQIGVAPARLRMDFETGVE